MVNTSDILPNTPRYLKVPLIFFNTVLWVLGVVLIALGGYSLNQLRNVKELVNVSLPAGVVVMGVFVFVLTIVGCAVAYKEKLVGLIFYTVVMILLLICLIGIGGGAFTYRENLRAPFTEAFKTSGPVIQNQIENYFHCCGWSVYNDSFHNITTAQYEKGTYNCVIPQSNNTKVVTNYTTNCTNTSFPYPDPDNSNTTLYNYTLICTNITTNETWYNTTTYIVKPADQMDAEGLKRCDDIVVEYTQARLYVAAVAGVVVGVIEFVCMLFSLFLIVRLCRSPRARTYE
eukprot:TRINITY_DN1063_c0_g1_i1.p1 TRINITY_DN1063_c0_g1~~TRINITY_DN1063_c0_g1_i1.p1  ORF type:complete len:287 (+),score=54.28 TRINITY_DN1063_c0_g1_i1:61-921(+)